MSTSTPVPTLNRNRPATVISATISETTRTHRSHVQEDHNYGEPGPSTLRQSRRIFTLSRHQRNADELDIPLINDIPTTTPPVDPLRLPESMSARLRHRPQPSNSISNRSNHLSSVSDEDITDPEDNKPLHLMVTESHPIRAKPSKIMSRNRRRNLSDDEANIALPGPSNSLGVSSRSIRAQKRPYYNEESDESISTNQRPNNYLKSANKNAHPAKRRLLPPLENEDDDEDEDDDDNDNDQLYIPTSRSHTNLNTTSNGRHSSHYNMRHQYVDENTNSDDGADDQQQISVSSRGRVRKISSKVRGYFRE